MTYNFKANQEISKQIKPQDLQHMLQKLSTTRNIEGNTRKSIQNDLFRNQSFLGVADQSAQKSEVDGEFGSLPSFLNQTALGKQYQISSYSIFDSRCHLPSITYVFFVIEITYSNNSRI